MLEIVRLPSNHVKFKCGEIHSYNARIFSFTCNFCDQILNNFDQFCLHIEKEHYKVTGDTATNEVPDSEFIEEYNSETLDSSRAEDDGEYFEEVEIESPSNLEEFEDKEFILNSPENTTIASESLNETEVDIGEFQLEQVLLEENNIQESAFLARSEETNEKKAIYGKNKKSSCMTKKNKKPAVRVFYCSHCDKSFKNKSNRNMHELRHKDIGDFQCNLCPKTFYTKMELTKHLRSHNDERPYICEVCGKGFRHIWVLKKHSITHKTLERTLPCPNCGKLFSTKDHLRIHLLTHNTIPMFGCDYCELTFTQRKRLNAHKRRYHKKT